MDYLYQRNRWVAAREGRPSKATEPGREISAAGKRVIVIGGGDTGMDCISNSNREGARSVVMLDVYQELQGGADPRSPWPLPPKRTASTYALEEGGKRRWGTEVIGFGGEDGHVTHVYARQVSGTSSRDLTPVPGSEFVLDADLVMIAIGFEHPEHEGLVAELAVDLDHRGNIRTEQTYRTSVNGVLRLRRRPDRSVAVVTAIAEGRKCARVVNLDHRRHPDGRRIASCWPSAPGAASRIAHCATKPRRRAPSGPGEQFFSGPGTRSAEKPRPSWVYGGVQRSSRHPS